MLDRVLTQPKEVWTRHRIGVLAISNSVGLLDDARPCSSGSPRDDRSIWRVAGYDLELGPVATVEDRAMVDDFNVWVDCREIPPKVKRDYEDWQRDM